MGLSAFLREYVLSQPPDNPSILSRITFACSTTLAAYVVSVCLRAPQTPRTVTRNTGDATGSVKEIPDRIRLALPLLGVYRRVFLFIAIWQSALIIHPYVDNPAVLNLRPEYPMNRWLLTWNPLSIVALTVIIVSACVRIRAFGQLGNDFTFELQAPQRLHTGGMYAYVQHPSYTTGFLAVMSHLAWFGRLDAALATVLPGTLLQWQTYLYYIGLIVAVTVISWGIHGRTRDEEALLKETFGKKWVDWASRTARFVPGFI